MLWKAGKQDQLIDQAIEVICFQIKGPVSLMYTEAQPMSKTEKEIQPLIPKLKKKSLNSAHIHVWNEGRISETISFNNFYCPVLLPSF